MKKLGDVEDCWQCRKAPGVVRGSGITFCRECILQLAQQLAEPDQRLSVKSTCSICFEILPMPNGSGIKVLEHCDLTIREMCIDSMVESYCR